MAGAHTVAGEGATRSLRIELHLQDTASGELLTSGTANGTEAGLFDLVSRAGKPLRAKLGLAEISVGQALEVEASLPANREAARLYAEGNLSAAQKLHDEALASFRQIGAKHDAALALNDIGARLQNNGDLTGAEKRHKEALTIFGEIGERSGVAVTLTNLGEVQYARGDLKRAQELHEEALANNCELSDKAGAAYDLRRERGC